MGSLQEHFRTLPPAPDRRCEARTTPASLAQVEFGNGGHNGIILNISEAGMAVAVAHALAVGERLPSVRFLLPISGRSSVQSVEICAEIVWLSESKKGAGMRFLGLSADARSHISNWITSERTAPDLEHLPKPVLRNKRPLEISAVRSRPIFSSPSIRDGEVVARYARMFPSESAYPRITATLDEIQREEEPPSSTTLCPHRAADIATPSLVAEVPMGGVTRTQASALPPERNDESAAEPIQAANGGEENPLTQDKPEARPPDNKIDLSQDRPNHSSSNFDFPEKSDLPEKSTEKGFKLQFAIFGFVLVAISFILGLTAGYGPIEKWLRSIHKPAPRPIAISPAPPIVPSEPSSSEPDGKLEASPAEASQTDSEVSQPDKRPAPPYSRSSNPATRATTTAPSKNPYPPPPLESKESKSSIQPENQPEEHSDPRRPAVENSAPPASPKPDAATPPPAAASTPSAPPDSAKPSPAPLPGPTPPPIPAPRHTPVPAPASVTIPPAENGKLVRAVFPRKSISASPSLGITSQLSVLISPAERSTVGDRETARLQAGDIISYVVPRQPRAAVQYNSTETVRVRAIISSDGRVTDVKPMSGQIFLLSSVTSAVQQWRFHPTLLNGAPVKAEDDVTIEFRLKQ